MFKGAETFRCFVRPMFTGFQNLSFSVIHFAQTAVGLCRYVRTMRFFASLNRSCGRIPAVVGTLLALSLGAQAELGGTEASVRSDQQRLRATRNVSQTPAYAIHEMRTANQSVIREFVSSEGKVFAVTYHGQLLGESNALLGSYAPQIGRALAASRGGKHRGGPVSVQLPGFVYEASGHMRSYVIHAYVTDSIPQGVRVEELR